VITNMTNAAIGVVRLSPSDSLLPTPRLHRGEK
jgi:hypothetical protein